jgi:hypothetical protein
MKDNEPSFSLNDFKKWMSKQKFEYVRKPRYKGYFAESKLGIKRLTGKIEIEAGSLLDIAKDFKKNGGVILDCSNDNLLLIEVSSGTFKIPKFFVKIISNTYDGS